MAPCVPQPLEPPRSAGAPVAVNGHDLARDDRRRIKENPRSIHPRRKENIR
jgi:hypothetical protein